MAAGESAEEERRSIREEFEELQREFRSMEAMKKAYADESLAIVRKQKEMIDRLLRENESLKAELDLEMRYAQKRQARDSKMTSIHDQLDLYTTRAAVESRTVGTLKENIEVIRAKIEEMRVAVGGANAGKENYVLKQKQIRTLENRLDKALVKFNEALARNKELRKEIDDLRQERVVFDGIYRKLEKDLEDRKRSMAEMIEESNAAYEVRDNATVQLMDLQAAMAREREEFEREIAELNAEIDEEEAEEDGDEEEGSPDRGELTIEEERDMLESRQRGDEDLAAERGKLREVEDRVAGYEEAFARIREATGMATVEELVEAFRKGEEENFGLFSFAAEQTAEIERLEDKVSVLRSEADAASAASGTADSTQRSALRDLEARRAAAQEAGEQMAQQRRKLGLVMRKVRARISRLFHRLDCHRRGQAEILAGTAVTETNALQFLGIIEERANEILQAYAAAKALDDGLVTPMPADEAMKLLEAEEKLRSKLSHSTSALSPPSSPTASPARSTAGGGGEGSGAGVVMVPTARKEAAKTVASVLGTGAPSAPPHPRGLDGDRAAPSLQVDVPRLRDLADDDADDDARPLTVSELKDSVRRTVYS